MLQKLKKKLKKDNTPDTAYWDVCYSNSSINYGSV